MAAAEEEAEEAERTLVLETWERFHHAHPLLYLPDRTPHGDFDGRDRHKRHWSRQEQLAFASAVQWRTDLMLQHQEDLVAHWQARAICVQRYVRGLLSRVRVLRIRDAFWRTAQEEALRSQQAIHRLRRRRAASTIQRHYRAHVQHQLLQHESCRCIQRAIRLFLRRQRENRAAVCIQSAYRRYRMRVRLVLQLLRIVRLIRVSRRREALEIHMSQFKAAKETRQLNELLVVARSYPETVRAYVFTQQRKALVRAGIHQRRLLPPLTTDHKSHHLHHQRPTQPSVRSKRWKPKPQSLASLV